jgi:hypothetical protein
MQGKIEKEKKSKRGFNAEGVRETIYDLLLHRQDTYSF